MIKIKTGNIFTSTCQTTVNTVNCTGVMGAGIALEFKLRYPQMFTRYAALCEQKKIGIGKLWLYKDSTAWVLNFPTKQHWRYPTKPDYLRRGLDKFMQTYQARQIQSIAFPFLGASKGGLSEDLSLGIMAEYLNQCTIPVEVYRYDPTASDDLFVQFCQKMMTTPETQLMQVSGLRKQALNKLKPLLDNPQIHTLSQLAEVKGVGIKTLEKAFKLMQQSNGEPMQQSIFSLD